mmetsp:Transcript_20228/g.48641  ORF Transcript_20228/g.48641 Transcript_20228/m.48641 type:complete len:85 (-) Transcript_20228:136-390(-)
MMASLPEHEETLSHNPNIWGLKMICLCHQPCSDRSTHVDSRPKVLRTHLLAVLIYCSDQSKYFSIQIPENNITTDNGIGTTPEP